MKVNLTLDAQNTLNGYENINLVEMGTYDLTAVCDAEAKEILANNVLQTCIYPKLKEVLALWIKKLRLGGKLVVCGIEGYSVAAKYNSMEISLEDFNKLIYGNHSVSVVNCEEVVDWLIELGLTITKKKIQGISFVVEGERNE